MIAHKPTDLELGGPGAGDFHLRGYPGSLGEGKKKLLDRRVVVFVVGEA